MMRCVTCRDWNLSRSSEPQMKSRCSSAVACFFISWSSAIPQHSNCWKRPRSTTKGFSFVPGDRCYVHALGALEREKIQMGRKPDCLIQRQHNGFRFRSRNFRQSIYPYFSKALELA